MVVQHPAGSLPRALLDAFRERLVALPGRYAATAVAASLMLMISMGVARPQAAAPQPSPPSTPGVQEPASPAPGQALIAPQPGEPAPAAVEEENSGLLHQMGKLVKKSLSVLPSPSETIDDLHTRAKDAGDTVSRFITPGSMVTGRIECPVAGNGAPDCKTGTDKLCQTKGFKDGRSLNIDSVEKCSIKAYLPGRTRKPDDCRTRNYVTRALCQ